jgi:hypothetical protein
VNLAPTIYPCERKLQEKVKETFFFEKRLALFVKIDNYNTISFLSFFHFSDVSYL